jgi:hypothetical protein
VARLLPLSGSDSPYTLPYHASPRTHFSGFGRPVKKIRILPPKTKGGGGPRLHSHSMEEQLLNSHYNQSKISPDRYMMMLNRDQDREREGCPFVLLALRDKSTHRNGANFHVPFSLVWFREPPVLTCLLKAVTLDFFRMPGKVPHLST